MISCTISRKRWYSVLSSFGFVYRHTKQLLQYKVNMFSLDCCHYKNTYLGRPLPSVCRDIFSLGFGPFRWVCTSGNPADLAQTDNIATTVLEEISATVSERVQQQYSDNIRWIREAGKHNMVCSTYNPVQCCVRSRERFQRMWSGGGEGDYNYYWCISRISVLNLSCRTFL